MGKFNLYYLRDRNKREVDFLITKNDKPWMLVEAKLGNHNNVSSALRYFQKMLKADYALQVVLELPYNERSCFVGPEPRIVPARSFLSQLV